MKRRVRMIAMSMGLIVGVWLQTSALFATPYQISPNPNAATITVDTPDAFNSQNPFENNGVINITDTGTLTNNTGAKLINGNTSALGTLTNGGTLINDGTLLSEGQLSNSGTLINHGSLTALIGNLTNTGTLTNTGSLTGAFAGLTNAGVLTNTGTLHTTRYLSNTGTLINGTGGTLTTINGNFLNVLVA